MGAWQEVATIGKTTTMQRGQTRGVREAREGVMSGQKGTRKIAEWISGSGVAEQNIGRLTPQSSVVSQASPCL